MCLVMVICSRGLLNNKNTLNPYLDTIFFHDSVSKYLSDFLKLFVILAFLPSFSFYKECRGEAAI